MKNLDRIWGIVFVQLLNSRFSLLCLFTSFHKKSKLVDKFSKNILEKTGICIFWVS